MSEQAWTSINQLKPGQIFEFSSTTALAAFEDVIVATIKPELTQREELAKLGWIALKDLIRPQSFNGTITGLALTVMETPADELLETRQNGVKFSKFGQMLLRSGVSSNSSLRGFDFTASAFSTGRDGKRMIHSKLWYIMQGSLRRIATQPELHAIEAIKPEMPELKLYRATPSSIAELRVD